MVEYVVIKELINIINLNKDANSQKLFIKIRPEIFKKLVQYSTIKFIESPLEIFIKNKFQFEKNRSNLTCRKLADAYYKSTGIKTNRQTVCNIIKKKLGYRYRKTTVKNNKINSDKNILISCAFLKIITRSIKIGFKVVYCDESGFCNKPTNYYTWKKKDDEIFFDYSDVKRFNLILAVDDNQVLYYKINTNSTDSKSFLEFMKELKIKLSNINYPNYILVLDNLSSHKTEELLEYYANNNINVVFNSPYISYFNAVELAFRVIKKKIYSILFSSSNSLKIIF